jgi:hypothetical protein
MRVFRWAWNLIGVGVSIQYGYWAVTWGVYGLSWLPSPPNITADWYFLGFSAAAWLTMDNAIRGFALVTATPVGKQGLLKDD